MMSDENSRGSECGDPATSKLMTGRQWKVTMRHMLTGRTLINGLGYIEKEKMRKTPTCSSST